MDSHSEVLMDLAELRWQLRNRGTPYRTLLRLSPVRPMLDIAVDWIIIFASVGSVVGVSRWLVPIAICLIANRQRALGNILHDAGHRNLWRDRVRNDITARLFVAPFLFASLSSYRSDHFRHHLALGDPFGDPDFLPIPARQPNHWVVSVARHVCSIPAWLGSVGGHLIAPRVPGWSKLYILGWWLTGMTALAALVSTEFATVFLALWLLARATVFHLITTFREMCDHHGLRPGGIFSFTRDMACHGIWSAVIHPRNNGYHLTHHLLPAIPYYRLPEAHRLFSQLPAYLARGEVCDAYFCGDHAVTRSWRSGARW